MGRLKIQEALNNIGSDINIYRHIPQEEYNELIQVGEDLAVFSQQINSRVYAIFDYFNNKDKYDINDIIGLIRYSLGDITAGKTTIIDENEGKKLEEFLKSKGLSLIKPENFKFENPVIEKIKNNLVKGYVEKLRCKFYDVNHAGGPYHKHLMNILSSDEDSGFNKFKRDSLVPLYLKEIEKQLAEKHSEENPEDLESAIAIDQELDSIQVYYIYTGLIQKESTLYSSHLNDRPISQIATSLYKTLKDKNSKEVAKNPKNENEYFNTLGSLLSKFSYSINRTIFDFFKNDTLKKDFKKLIEEYVKNNNSNNPKNIKEEITNFFKGKIYNLKEDIIKQLSQIESTDLLGNINNNLLDTILKSFSEDFMNSINNIKISSKVFKDKNINFTAISEKILNNYLNYFTGIENKGFNLFKTIELPNIYLDSISKSIKNRNFINNNKLTSEQIRI